MIDYWFVNYVWYTKLNSTIPGKKEKKCTASREKRDNHKYLKRIKVYLKALPTSAETQISDMFIIVDKIAELIQHTRGCP